MSQIQEKNNKYEMKFCLSELYTSNDQKKIFKIIPELLNLFQSPGYLTSSQNKFITSPNDDSENIPKSNWLTKINKFSFFKIILSKLKSYFEINESYIIIKAISFILNEMEIIEKNFILNKHHSKSKSKNSQKGGVGNEKENKSSIKYEKIKKISTKINTSNQLKTNQNNGLNNPYFNLLKNLTNTSDINSNNRKKVYFKVLDNHINKDNKTEINPYCTKANDAKKINIDLNQTERKIRNNNLSLSDLKKMEYHKIIEKQKNSSDVGLKIYIDSDNKTQPNNFSTNLDINNHHTFEQDKKGYIKKLNNKSDLFNNNNNLYINIYEHKKNNESTPESISFNIESNADNEAKIKKDNNISNNNNLNISLLNNIENQNFDIFELDKKTSKNSLTLIGCYIFNRYGFHNIMNYSMFQNWCRKIAEGYGRKNPYHTDLHAGDVTQTCFVFFKIGKINEFCKLSQLSKCALFLSCICHDYKHPGLNNNFLKDSKNILAIKYNDNSILENMHISETFKLTIDYPNCDIFWGMNSDNYKRMRKEMISCVLCTDMINHRKAIDFMGELINNKKNINNNIKNEETDNHQQYMNLLIHSADISNPTKKFDIYWKWAELVVEEFFRQGDKEKELGLKCTFDREATTKYQNQLGFINNIAIPFYSLFVSSFPKLKFLMDNINYNKNEISALQEKNRDKEIKKINDKNKK